MIPEAAPEGAGDVDWAVEGGQLGRYGYEKHAEDGDFSQAGALVRLVMDDTDRSHLVTNIVSRATNEVTDGIQLRVVAYWTVVDPDLGVGTAGSLVAIATMNSDRSPESCDVVSPTWVRAYKKAPGNGAFDAESTDHDHDYHDDI